MMIFGYIGVVHPARLAVAGDRRRALRDRHRPDARRVRALARAQGRLLGEGRAQVDRRDDHRRLRRRRRCWSASAPGSTLADDVEDGGLRRRSAPFGLVGIVVALVNAAKEKFWWALGVADPLARRGGRRVPAREAALALGAALLPRRARARGRASATRPPGRGGARAGSVRPPGSTRPTSSGGGQISSKIAPSEAATGIASRAPRMPASWAPASTATIATAGWIWTAFL